MSPATSGVPHSAASGALASRVRAGTRAASGDNGSSAPSRRILQPDLATQGDRGVNFRVGLEQRVERRYESPDSVSVQRKARRHADLRFGVRAAAQRLGEQGPEVREVARDDHSLFLGKRGEVDTIRTSSQVGALADGDRVVSPFTQLPGDLGREMLVEQQLQARSLPGPRARCSLRAR